LNWLGFPGEVSDEEACSVYRDIVPPTDSEVRQAYEEMRNVIKIGSIELHLALAAICYAHTTTYPGSITVFKGVAYFKVLSDATEPSESYGLRALPRYLLRRDTSGVPNRWELLLG